MNASLETLQQLLQSPPHGLFQVLLNERGILRSRIHASDQPEKLTHRSLSKKEIYFFSLQKIKINKLKYISKLNSYLGCVTLIKNKYVI